VVLSLCSAALLMCAVRTAWAQETGAGSGSLSERLNLDKLQIFSLGGSIGHIRPTQLEATTVYAVQADYGEIAPSWHVVFGGSYWTSRFRDAVIQSFVDTLNKQLTDPSAKVRPSPISLYDVTIGGELRYSPVYSGELKGFLGFGVAAHVINAEGALINGTFVERSLDAISSGTYVTAGVSFKLVKHVGIEGSVRGDLLSGFRSTQIRGGATYYFGQIRTTTQQTGGGEGIREP
jgi:hypothetical protein